MLYYIHKITHKIQIMFIVTFVLYHFQNACWYNKKHMDSILLMMLLFQPRSTRTDFETGKWPTWDCGPYDHPLGTMYSTEREGEIPSSWDTFDLIPIPIRCLCCVLLIEQYIGVIYDKHHILTVLVTRTDTDFSIYTIPAETGLWALSHIHISPINLPYYIPELLDISIALWNISLCLAVQEYHAANLKQVILLQNIHPPLSSFYLWEQFSVIV